MTLARPIILVGALAFLVMACLMGGANAMQHPEVASAVDSLAAEAVSNPPVKVMDPAHIAKHPEAGEVMRCEFMRGVYISWDKSMNCYKFELIKQLKDGRLCNQVTFPTDAGLLVKTAYAYAIGVGMDDLDKIMRSKGCTRIK